MAGEALGLVEVRGMLGAVVAADAALKAANVTLLSIEPVKAGLRTVELIGDVGAIRAAVDAAVDSVKDMDCYLGSHVIARVDEQTKRIYGVVNTPEKPAETMESVVDNTTESDDLVEVVNVIDSMDTEGVKGDEESILTTNHQSYSREELEAMKVVKLREIAYRHPNIKLTKKQIKFGNKQTLIDALLK